MSTSYDPAVFTSSNPRFPCRMSSCAAAHGARCSVFPPRATTDPSATVRIAAWRLVTFDTEDIRSRSILQQLAGVREQHRHRLRHVDVTEVATPSGALGKSFQAVGQHPGRMEKER